MGLSKPTAFILCGLVAAGSCTGSAFGQSSSSPQHDTTPPTEQAYPKVDLDKSQGPRGAHPVSTRTAKRLWRQFHAEKLAGRQDTHGVLLAYAAILDRWTRQPADAVELLAELQYRLYASTSCRFAEEKKVHRLLAEQAPDALLPTAALHIRAWRSALEKRRFFGLAEEGARIESIAERYVKSASESADSRLEAARMLTYFADQVWEGGYVDLLPVAVSALDRAIDHSPDLVAARYLRASISEKQGLYRRAQKDLEHLHRLLPEQTDVTLRLAIQQARRGKIDRADELLTRLTDEPDGSWTQAVAFQERIRLHLDQNEVDRARALLTEAEARFPDLTRFALLDTEIQRRQTGKSGPRSREILDRWQKDIGITPRLRYLFGPVSELEANRRVLAGDLEERSSDLTLSLQGPAFLNLRGSTLCREVWRRLLPDDPEPSGSGLPPTPRTTVASFDAPALFAPDPETSTPPQPLEPAQHTTYVDEQTGTVYRVDEVVDLDLQQLYVTPSRFGRKGHSLDATQVTVLDDGKPQEIVTFEQGNIPFTATLLIDASGSMRGPQLRRAVSGARAFMTEMAPLDRSRLVVAADRLRGVSSFVSAEDAAIADLTDRLDQAQAGGGTALFDHIFLTVDALAGEHGRKVVVVLSDGFDLMSAVPVDSVREAIRRSQIQLYWVRLRARSERELTPPTSWRPTAETRRQTDLLEKTVIESGGEVVDIEGAHQVADAFGKILDDLRNQIAIGYYADPAYGDGRWRDVKVKAEGVGVRLRHTAGYFDRRDHLNSDFNSPRN